MQYIAILVCAVCFLLSWKREKNMVNPLTIMSGLWTISTVLASMRLYGLYEADSLVYLLIAVGIASFGVGSAMLRKRKAQVFINLNATDIESKEISDAGKINTIGLRALCLLSALMMIYPDYLAVKSLLSSGFDMAIIRSEFDMPYSNILLQLIYNYIVLPFSFAASPIFATLLFIGKRKDKLVYFSLVFIIFSRLIAEGGRAIILYLLLAIIVAYSATKTKKKAIKKGRIWIYLLIAVCIFAVIAVTNSRTDQSLFEHGYLYLCGGIPHLSVRLEEVATQGVLTHGTASLFGYMEFIFTIFENIGFSYPSFMIKASSAVKGVVETTVAISSNKVMFNAFVSPFYYMYCDGRILGVIVGMLIYGMVSFHFYKKLKNRQSYRNLSVYLLMVQGLVFSFVRIQFATVHYSLAFFFFYFVFSNKNAAPKRQ